MYRKLEVWKKAYSFSLDIYIITRNYPKEELYGITSQIRRSAASIPANIAEGNARNSRNEYRQFVSIARGSAAELETWLLLSRDLGFISDDVFLTLEKKLDEIKALLYKLMKSLEN